MILMIGMTPIIVWSFARKFLLRLFELLGHVGYRDLLEAI